jgi:hypothetical protein
MPAVAMPSAVPTMMSSPSNLCRVRPDVLPNRCGRTGIAERQRLRALAWSGKGEQCANGSKAQNFRHLHIWSPSICGMSRRHRSGSNQGSRIAATQTIS